MNDPVKSILLDEDNFWGPLVDTLKVMTPVVMLLRLTDGTAPVMGKILPRMASIREETEKLDIPWKFKVLEIHNMRWEYLQSPMHFAGTCLDPEFLLREMDEATQDGLITLTERLCLRREMQSRQEEGSAGTEHPLTISSDKVQAQVAAAMLQYSQYQEKEGIFSKPHVQDNAKVMPPSAWWAMFGRGLPIASSMAQTVLSQPACASAAGELLRFLVSVSVSL